MFSTRRAASAVLATMVISLPLTPLLPSAAYATRPSETSAPLLTEAGTVLRPRPLFDLPVVSYRLTGRFDDVSGLWAHRHTGLDFAAPSGTPIHAIAGGVVTAAGWDGSYGNKTVITMPNGTELWFAHQSQFLVSVGQKVVTGQVIGLIGSTGNTTGPHVHVEVRPTPDNPIDPLTWLQAQGLRP